MKKKPAPKFKQAKVKAQKIENRASFDEIVKDSVPLDAQIVPVDHLVKEIIEDTGMHKLFQPLNDTQQALADKWLKKKREQEWEGRFKPTDGVPTIFYNEHGQVLNERHPAGYKPPVPHLAFEQIEREKHNRMLKLHPLPEISPDMMRNAYPGNIDPAALQNSFATPDKPFLETYDAAWQEDTEPYTKLSAVGQGVAIFFTTAVLIGIAAIVFLSFTPSNPIPYLP